MDKKQVKVIKPRERRVETAFGTMTRVEGVSRHLGGAEGIHLSIASIPPHGRSSPHYHINCESAIYGPRGKAVSWLGMG